MTLPMVASMPWGEVNRCSRGRRPRDAHAPLRSNVKETGFQISEPQLELKGICPNCQSDWFVYIDYEWKIIYSTIILIIFISSNF